MDKVQHTVRQGVKHSVRHTRYDCRVKTLAEQVGYIRTEMGLSKAAFGRAIGVSRSAVQQIEEGATQSLKADTVLAIERVSGFSGDWVASGRGPTKKHPSGLTGSAIDQADQMYRALLSLPQEQRDKIQSDIDFFVHLNQQRK